ncbi:hypothetical protein DQE80_17050, partial [Enterococcus sp. HPCN18]
LRFRIELVDDGAAEVVEVDLPGIAYSERTWMLASCQNLQRGATSWHLEDPSLRVGAVSLADVHASIVPDSDASGVGEILE